MKQEHVNQFFRKDIPLIAPEDPRRVLRLRRSQFEKHRSKEQVLMSEQQATPFAGEKDRFQLLRGKRQFAYHVMALMVKKEYGNIPKAMESMIAVAAKWEHKPFIEEVDGEIKQVVPFSNQSSGFEGGFQSTPAERVESKSGEPEKVSFEWRTNLY